MSERVTAVYELGGRQDFDVEITAAALRYRAVGDKRWTAVPWNEAFSYIDAGLDSDIQFRAMRQLMSRGRKR